MATLQLDPSTGDDLPPVRRRSRRSALTALLVAVALVAAACGGDDDDDATSEPAASEETAATDDGTDEAPSDSTEPPSDPAADVTTTTAVAVAEGLPEGADPDGVLRIGYDLISSARAGGITFDLTAITGNLTDVGMLYTVYGGLLRRTAAGEMVPDLAENVEIVDDATILITLREGLTYSDGTPFDADAVKAGFELLLTDGDPAAFIEAYFNLQTIDVVSPIEVQLNIGAGAAAAWHDTFMGSWETMIMKPGHTDHQNPIGAGPMVLTEWRPEQSMSFEPNPTYWDADSITLGGLEVVHTVDPVSVTNGIRSDQIDVGTIDAIQAAQFEDDELLVLPGQDRAVHFMTCKRDAPLDDVLVRQALNLAVDRETLNEVAYNGLASPMTGLWPEGHQFDNPDVTTEYDPDRARELLAEAGYGDGLEVDLYVIQAEPMPTVAEVVQQMFADVGVTLNIIPSPNYVDEFLTAQQPGLGLVPAWGANRGEFGQWSGEVRGNTCNYVDPEIDAMVAELNTLSDSDPRTTELWHELEAKIMGEDSLSIFLLFGSLTAAIDTDRVALFTPVPFLILWPDLRASAVRAG